MNKWLITYDYRIEITLWIFVFSALISIAVALLTISIQTIKAALVNAVYSLKTK